VQDIRAQRLGPDVFDKLLDHWQRDVGFQQRQAHLSEGVLNVRFSNAGLAPQGLDDMG
jgi:hypothetical protein